MKRSIALLISAGVTALILIVVLAVSNPGVDSAANPAAAQQSTPGPTRLEDVQSAASFEDDGEREGEREREDEGSEHEFKGTIEAIAGNAVTIDGQTVLVTAQTEIEGSISVGDFVEVHAWAQDGSLWAREIEREDD